ncbi:ABC transporter permease [Rhizobium leguminosarum]|uniref:ABC transporter permease n=1 Tax=Rhizobium leguminosarum TaxID=384 RepID=UPI0024A96E4F|nr:ABC transporter permease [Rhizobium leguminosarum]MDI5930012.1 ABC transporter permease [Rhizobium leguminosarum]
MTNMTVGLKNWTKVATGVGSRLVANILTIIVISVLVFLLMNFKGPNEIAISILGRDASQEQLTVFIQSNRLNLPISQRYLSWIGHAMMGDFGTSVSTGRAVLDDVFPALQVSATLAFFSALVGIGFGIVIGVFLAVRAGSKSDFRIVVGLIALAALPEFIVGICLYLIFAVFLGWLPSENSFAFSFGTFGDRVVAFILPTLTLAALIVPQVARVTRAAMTEALASGYVSSARLRGLKERQIVWDHAFRNASVPLAGVLGLNVAFAMTGTLSVETVFGLPGLGSMLVSSIASGDVFTTQTIIMIFAVLIAVVNIFVDLAVLALNPRLRFKA